MAFKMSEICEKSSETESEVTKQFYHIFFPFKKQSILAVEKMESQNICHLALDMTF